MKQQEPQLWQAVVNNDSSQDGRFFYGVMTTGIYCRPSCSSKLPKRENVRFYLTPEAAEQDGLRACKRCQPTAQNHSAMRALMVAMCRYIEQNYHNKLSLENLAEEAGMSVAHFQKTFKKHIGLSPKKYQDACRFNAFKQHLKEDQSITRASVDSGFQSSSRLYEKIDTQLGVKPSVYKKGGQGLDIFYADGQTPIGHVMIGATERGICFLQFADDAKGLRAFLQQDFPQAILHPMPIDQQPLFDVWMEALNHYLSGHIEQLQLPLDIQGTAFQKMVWDYLQTIPAGELRSYQQVAAALNKPQASRAVASACGRNRIAIAIPCHRVVRGNGQLAGYKWGVPRKQKLIHLEQSGTA
ncbi:bifunctional DNA-binding transcriptional regulator/O6-methylguanine-DNA methyltransferase Ada [Marinicella sp. W31]|uniref:bifunctional DNA-binding transcriptional regulator/O6-methylguanine-DNA methyltransferase Ada n=1 Tax=Marinicella sp. W31 TaxID=3023713 RepID=UPI0037573D14